MKKLYYFKLLFFALAIMIGQNAFADTKLLYSTDFQDWTTFANPTSAVSVSKTTSFTNETLTFKFLNVYVNSTSYDATKFNYNIASTGAMIATKMSSATDSSYMVTSPISSITKLFVVIGATGSNRGYKIQKKADGDTDWVDVYTAVANPISGDSTTISIPGSQTNVALRFTNLAYNQNAYLFNLQIYGDYQSSAAQKTLTTSVNIAAAGTVETDPTSSTYDENTQVELTANRNFGYAFQNWVDLSTNTVLSTDNPYTITMDADKNIQAVFKAINTYSLDISVNGGAKSYMVALSPSPEVINDKNMYEEGTAVTLTSSSNPILTFTNWDSGETSGTKTITMDANKSVTASYSATDYIAGWDFYNTGSGSRTADFYEKSENESSTLIIRNADGTTGTWLDKSNSSGGYEGRNAAVNWNTLTNNYYFQLSFDATNYTNISIMSGMLYNYNTYSVQNVQYSLDGVTFTTIGTFNLATAKVWYDQTLALPSDANHASKVYIRWIPDYTSSIVGTTYANDGAALSRVYIFGTAETANDGVAPVLSTSVPAQNGTGASTTGKVVLTFDEKVTIADGTTGTLNGKSLTPTVSSKTITFPYTGLSYNTEYTFTVPANTISDAGGNFISSDISITFTTLARPTVTKKAYDFVVGVDGDFKAAMTAAQAAASSNTRFRIFFPNGEYNIGSATGDDNQKTTITTPNLSLIGQNPDSVILYNQNTSEGIAITATVNFTSAANNEYLQDLTLRNMDFRSGTTSLGRCVVLQDQGTENIYKNVKLQSNQDTYYSGTTIRSYFEDCTLHGTVDFLCGGGDVFFNECLLYLEDRSGNCITAPASSTSWGYVFSNCTIDGYSSNNNSYRLGRSWDGTPRAVYLNTTMNVLPVATGWADPMNVLPSLFAEYNSMTASGSTVDLSTRRTTYVLGTDTVKINPILSDEDAATYTVDNVLSGSDSWTPQLYTDQATAPAITGEGRTISWDNNDYVLCWAIFKDNVFVTSVITNSYTIPSTISSGTYTVKAANEMGGLSEASNAYALETSGISNTTASSELLYQKYYTLDGKILQSIQNYKGVIIVRSYYSDGKTESEKLIQ